jgi:hypothetical protein
MGGFPPTRAAYRKKPRRLAMLKRLRLWTYLTVAVGASLFQFGCNWGSSLYNTDVDSWPRIITAILREDIFG